MPRTPYPLTVLLFSLLVLCGCNGENTKRSAEVRNAFDRYFAAVQDREGQTAVDLVSSSTIDYYQKLIDHSLDASEAQTKALPLVDKVTVVMVRHRISAETLREMTGHDLYVYGVKNGWVGDDGMNRMVNGDYDIHFEVDGHVAWGNLEDTSTGQRAERILRMVYEDGAWKLDAQYLIQQAQPELRKQIVKKGMRENQFVELVAGMDSDREVTPAVWLPVGRETAD